MHADGMEINRSADLRGQSNLISDYYPLLGSVMRALEDEASAHPSTLFAPAFALPVIDDQVREFFAAATASWLPLGSYGECRLTLLDLMQNPGTHTTKTFASLLMVARAIEHIRRTGEGILLVAPTSGNKGVALRDAVERALLAGLASPEQLRVAVVAPKSASNKFPNSRLATDETLRRLNPLFLYEGPVPGHVKEIARSFVQTEGAEIQRRYGLKAWFSLDLRNYQAGDAARAFIENEIDPFGLNTAARFHAHAVSSAYGLLGYNLGLNVLERAGKISRERTPGFLLVQHLATPDMVLSLYHDSFSRANIPAYRHNALSGLHEQRSDDHFPYYTWSPDEEIDRTFYTREPVTSPRMNLLIRRHGGGGIVVSLAECFDRYAKVRQLLGECGVNVPADPRSILEWSLIMALVGVMNALDRNLIPQRSHVVVHGTGLYSTATTPPLDGRATTMVTSAACMARALELAG